MIEILIAVQIIALIGLALCAIALIRNEMTYRYFMRVIERVYNNNIQAILNNQVPTLSYDLVNKVSYDRMMWSLWRSFDSFFPPEYRPEKDN